MRTVTIVIDTTDLTDDRHRELRDEVRVAMLEREGITISTAGGRFDVEVEDVG